MCEVGVVYLKELVPLLSDMSSGVVKAATEAVVSSTADRASEVKKAVFLAIESIPVPASFRCPLTIDHGWQNLASRWQNRWQNLDYYECGSCGCAGRYSGEADAQCDMCDAELCCRCEGRSEYS